MTIQDACGMLDRREITVEEAIEGCEPELLNKFPWSEDGHNAQLYQSGAEVALRLALRRILALNTAHCGGRGHVRLSDLLALFPQRLR